MTKPERIVAFKDVLVINYLRQRAGECGDRDSYPLQLGIALAILTDSGVWPAVRDYVDRFNGNTL